MFILKFYCSTGYNNWYFLIFFSVTK